MYRVSDVHFGARIYPKIYKSGARRTMSKTSWPSLLGVAIKQTSEGSSLSRRIAAVERRMGIENAKNLGEMLLGMADQNLYTAGDYDTVIRNLRKNQIDLASEIAEMQEKKKGFAVASKNLQLCKTYRSVWLEYTGLPLDQKTEFYATHSRNYRLTTALPQNWRKKV